MVRLGPVCELHRREPFEARMGSVDVVVVSPGIDHPAGMAVASEQVLIEALVAEPADEGLDQFVLHRLARGDVVPIDLGVLLPLQEGIRGEFGAIVGDYGVRALERVSLSLIPSGLNPFSRPAFSLWRRR